MVAVVILAFVLATSLSVDFFEPVSGKDLALELAFQALVVVDVMQTSWGLYESGDPELQEVNFVLGSHPSKTKLCLLAGGGMLLHALIFWAIPKELREWWVYYTGAIEVLTVGMNFYELGFHLSVPF